MNTCGLLGSSFLAVSTVTTRCATPTWMAASPTPGALYIVSNMSSTSVRRSAVMLFTGSDTCRSRLSGRMMISRNAMRGDLSGALSRVNRAAEMQTAGAFRHRPRSFRGVFSGGDGDDDGANDDG